MEIQLSNSNRQDKRFKADFYKNGEKIETSHFGSKFAETFIDHQDERKRLNYIKRHSNLGTQNWSDPMTPGSLSRYILWEKPTLDQGLKYFAKRFGLTIKKD